MKALMCKHMERGPEICHDLPKIQLLTPTYLQRNNIFKNNAEDILKRRKAKNKNNFPGKKEEIVSKQLHYGVGYSIYLDSKPSLYFPPREVFPGQFRMTAPFFSSHGCNLIKNIN
ncbi:hypothetical protein BpHYR1_029011 [Brachionus plicatilis]|uniref:Uncharacterized protein n=1 Tax=Brachionus plicatilis TaxID=10195 RepID=A0A3M7SWS9_BRAPC|nr:hypothetical protein BpHYR1_029011 [Brachionus plicatilis]